MGNDTSSRLKVPTINAKNNKDVPIQAQGVCEFEIPKRYDPDERRDSSHSLNKITVREIDTAIYSNPLFLEDFLIPPAFEPPPLGTLAFEVQYQKYEEQLNVHLIDARRLPVRHLLTQPGVTSHEGIIKCNPMVEVCLLPEGKPLLKSYTYFDNQNPQFNEHFIFKVSPANLKNKHLRFTVYDEKRKHILTPIGHVLYSLKGHGQDGVPIERKIIERNLKLNSLPYGHTRGEVLVSLNYNLISHAITVGIERAEVTFIHDLHSIKKYFVKVTEICAGQKLKTKITETASSERHLVFNSYLSFQVSPSKLSHTSLVVTLVGCGKLRSNTTVGRVVLGPSIYESNSERSHWGRMTVLPTRSIQQWHALYL